MKEELAKFPMIAVVHYLGRNYTMDNRRLWMYRVSSTMLYYYNTVVL